MKMRSSWLRRWLLNRPKLVGSTGRTAWAPALMSPLASPLADVPLGLPPRSKATAAFARQHLATKRAEAKASELKAKLDNLTERRCLRLVRGLN